MKKQTGADKPSYPFIESTPAGLYIRLRIQPRSSRNLIDGVHGGALKVRLTAPPVENEANKSLIDFLAKALGLKKSMLTLEAGHKSKDKRVRVDGLTPGELARIFAEKFGPMAED